jgi:hypothetical protein
VTDPVGKRKRHVPQKGGLAGVFAILYGVAMLGGLQVETAGAQSTRVTSVSVRPKEHTLSATGTAVREPTSSATGTSVRESTSSATGTAAREPTPSATGIAAGEPTPSPTRAAPAAGPKSVSKLAGRYFVDFRSRTAASYGHAFLCMDG